MTKVSIIIPIYNSEMYLDQCINSCVNQTIKDIEIICINDGSTDNSQEIINRYAQKDTRIKAIIQQNQGVSIARNKGINKAIGDYLIFVDSDDWLELNTCERIIQEAYKFNPDIINFQSFYVNKKKKKYKHKFVMKQYVNELKNKITNFDNDIVKNFQVNDLILCWDKAYKKEFLKNNNILFNESLNLMEDCIFILNCYENNPTIKFLNEYLYNHRIGNLGSLTRGDCYQKFLDHTKVELPLTKYIKAFNNQDLGLIIFEYYLKQLIADYSKIIFSKEKDKYIYKMQIILKNCLAYGIKNEQLLNLKTYKKLKFWITIDKYKLSWLYWKLIRPIVKYIIILLQYLVLAK